MKVRIQRFWDGEKPSGEAVDAEYAHASAQTGGGASNTVTGTQDAPERPLHQGQAQPPISRRSLLGHLAATAGITYLCIEGGVHVVSRAAQNFKRPDGKDKLREVIASDSPRLTGLFDEVYTSLLEKIPQGKRAKLIKPALYTQSNDKLNGHFNWQLHNETSKVAITTGAYSVCDDDEIKYILGHELGHWLCRLDKNLARKIGGMQDNPKVGAELKKIRKKVDEIFPDKIRADACYEENEEEVIADCLSASLSCSLKGIRSFHKKAQNEKIQSVTDALLAGKSMTFADSVRINERIQELVGLIDNAAITSHPEANSRVRIFEAVVRSSGCAAR